MASVSDSIGGISNLTLQVNVTYPPDDIIKDKNILLTNLKAFQISDDEILKLTIYA